VVEIIAEAGSNHNGSVDMAKALVDAAARAGADSVKFQFIFPDGLYLPEILVGHEYRPLPAFRRRQEEQLSRQEWREVWEHARDRGIPASASVFDGSGIELLSGLGAPYAKVASTDLTNLELIAQACEAFERVIVSTGMGTLAEVDRTYRFVTGNFPDVDLVLLHCVSVYPCPVPSANLDRMHILASAFACPVGYSDHTLGNVASALAVHDGAPVVEKHFTLDRSLPGFDHRHALEEKDLVDFVGTLRSVSEMAAPAQKGAMDAEETTKKRARRGLYAARDLPAGYVLRREDLLYVRPATESDLQPEVLIGAVLEVPVRRFQAVGLGRTANLATSHAAEAQDYWQREMREKGLTGDP